MVARSVKAHRGQFYEAAFYVCMFSTNVKDIKVLKCTNKRHSVSLVGIGLVVCVFVRLNGFIAVSTGAFYFVGLPYRVCVSFIIFFSSFHAATLLLVQRKCSRSVPISLPRKLSVSCMVSVIVQECACRRREKAKLVTLLNPLCA